MLPEVLEEEKEDFVIKRNSVNFEKTADMLEIGENGNVLSNYLTTTQEQEFLDY